MDEKPGHLFNPSRAAKAQRLPAKIWELLRRNKAFCLEVKKFHALDKRARRETVKYSEIAGLYNKAIAEQDTALIAKWQPRYDAVKNRPLRRKTSDVIESHQKVHPLAALALMWLVPEPEFSILCKRNGRIQEGHGFSPHLHDSSWSWRDVYVGRGRKRALKVGGESWARGPGLAASKLETPFPEWQNWRTGRALFDCSTSWNCLPRSFKSEFVRVWRECYDSGDAREIKYIFPPRKTAKLSRADAARYFDFLETVSHSRLFAISPAILTTKDVGAVFERLQNRIKRKLPESREHLFGSEAAWRHYLAIKERRLGLAEHIVGPGYKSEDSAAINEAVRNKRRNVQCGVNAIEKLITLVYPKFEFNKIVLVHSAPLRDKVKRRKP